MMPMLFHFNSRLSDQYMYVSANHAIIGSDNGLSLGWHQTFISTNTGLLLIVSLEHISVKFKSKQNNFHARKGNSNAVCKIVICKSSSLMMLLCAGGYLSQRHYDLISVPPQPCKWPSDTDVIIYKLYWGNRPAIWMNPLNIDEVRVSCFNQL